MLLQYQPLTVYNFCFRVKFMSLDRLRSCRCALACLLWPRGPFEAENIFSSEKPPPFDFNSASEKTAKHVKIIVKTRFHSPFYELKRISLCIESPPSGAAIPKTAVHSSDLPSQEPQAPPLRLLLEPFQLQIRGGKCQSVSPHQWRQRAERPALKALSGRTASSCR